MFPWKWGGVFRDSHMFCTGEVFNPTDLRQIDMPKEIKKKNVTNAIRLLKQQGVLPENFVADSYA